MLDARAFESWFWGGGGAIMLKTTSTFPKPSSYIRLIASSDEIRLDTLIESRQIH